MYMAYAHSSGVCCFHSERQSKESICNTGSECSKHQTNATARLAKQKNIVSFSNKVTIPSHSIQFQFFDCQASFAVHEQPVCTLLATSDSADFCSQPPKSNIAAIGKLWWCVCVGSHPEPPRVPPSPRPALWSRKMKASKDASASKCVRLPCGLLEMRGLLLLCVGSRRSPTTRTRLGSNT